MSGWTPTPPPQTPPYPHPGALPSSSSYFFPSTLLSYHQPSSLLTPTSVLKTPTIPPTQSVQTDMHRDTQSLYPPPEHTDTHAHIHFHAHCQSATRVSRSDRHCLREREDWKNGSKSGPSVTLSLSAPSVPPLWMIGQRGTRKECEGSKWDGDREGKESGGFVRESGGWRGELKCPHFLTGQLQQRARRDTALGWRFFAWASLRTPPPNPLRSPLRWPHLDCFPSLCQLWLLLTG